jgi:hypothetical protein
MSSQDSYSPNSSRPHACAQLAAQLRQQHPRFIYRDFYYQLQHHGPTDSRSQQERAELKIEFEFALETKHELNATQSSKQKSQIVFRPTLTIADIDLTRWRHLPQAFLQTWIFHLGLAEIPSYWKAACPAQIELQAGSLSQEQQQWWHDLLIQGLGEFFYQNQIDFTQADFVSFINTPRIKDKEQNPQAQIEGRNSAERDESRRQNQRQTKAEKGELRGKAAKGLAAPELSYRHQYLVPVGGGKDSSLTLALLKQAGLEFGCLQLLPQSPAAAAIIKHSPCRRHNKNQHIKITRRLDPQLLKLNQQGYLNGHTPFSAYLSFVSTFAAHLFGYQHVLVANERSANQGNIHYLEREINHQYSKSFEYETKFRRYAQQFLGSKPGRKLGNKSMSSKPLENEAKPTAQPDKNRRQQTDEQKPQSQANYLSFLRPLHELQIARLFAQQPSYHPLFKSCNVGQKQGVWCQHCPKCLFVFTLLYPFTDYQILTEQIFQQDLFNNPELVRTALALAGASQAKPFECVGTFRETQAAFYLAKQKIKQQSQQRGQAQPAKYRPGQKPGHKAALKAGQKITPNASRQTTTDQAPLPPVLAAIEQQVLSQRSSTHWQQLTESLLQDWNPNHYLPSKLEQVLRSALSALPDISISG